jgi:hypothetical protein
MSYVADDIVCEAPAGTIEGNVAYREFAATFVTRLLTARIASVTSPAASSATRSPTIRTCRLIVAGDGCAAGHRSSQRSAPWAYGGAGVQMSRSRMATTASVSAAAARQHERYAATCLAQPSAYIEQARRAPRGEPPCALARGGRLRAHAVLSWR